MVSTASTASPSRREGKLQRVLAAALLLAATYQLVDMLAVMWHLRAAAIFADQWYIFRTYLDLPFPENAFVNQNGHLVLFPSLVFLADIYFFDGEQWFPFLFGMGLCLATVGTMAYVSKTDEELPLVTRSAAIAIFVLLLFWAGGSRTLLHSNEIVSIFFVVSSVQLAYALLIRAGDPAHPRPESERSAAIFAGLLSLVSTYSFGTGLAGFPVTLLLASMLRLSRTTLVILATFFAVALVSYVAALMAPGGAPVKIELKPLGLLHN